MLAERLGGGAGAAAFYRRLLESPNFLAWFERRRGAAWAWQARPRAGARLSMHSSVFTCCKGPGAGEGGRPCALGLPAQARSVRLLGGGRVSGAAGCAHALQDVSLQ